MSKNKKLSITVEVADGGGFRVELGSGFLHKQNKVAESVDGLVSKISEFLRTELKGVPK